MKKYYFASFALMAILVTSIGGQQSASALMGTDALPAGGILDFYELLDSSGSISSTEFQLMLDGTVAALNGAITPSEFGKVRVTVIQFSSSASLECQQLVTNAADLLALTTCVAAISKSGGGTAIHAAYNVVTAELMISPVNGVNDRSIVDLVTDGQSSASLATTAVNAAIAAGLDSNVALAIGSGASLTFLQSIAFPNPPGPLNPAVLPDPLVQGFVLNVQTFQEFADAMLAKFQVAVSTPVGGEFLPIDNAALLLAGAQTNAVWIMSALAVIGSVAFGALYITSKKN